MYNFTCFIVFWVYYGVLLEASQRLPTESTEIKRKFVHILFGNWWFAIVMLSVDWGVLFLFSTTLVIVNYVSMKIPGGWLAKLDEGRNIKSHGIVLYPIAVVILLLVSFKYDDLRVGAIGIIPLAYGDGMAALVGQKLNYKPFFVSRSKKSVSGCCTMFCVSFIVLSIYIYLSGLNGDILEVVLSSLIISFVAMIVEMITPWGFDNISVSAVSVFMYSLLFYK